MSLLAEDDEEAEVDEDVRREEEDLTDGFPDDAPVVIYKLRKEVTATNLMLFLDTLNVEGSLLFSQLTQYSSSRGRPPHVAVDCFSLAIERNECFGLLGPNGMFFCPGSLFGDPCC